MNHMMDFEQDASVKDMNLEAKLDKELLLHGFLRRDFSEEEIAQLRAELQALGDGNCSVFNGFFNNENMGLPATKDDNPDKEPEAKFAVGDRVWVTDSSAIACVPGVGVVRGVDKEWVDLGDELQGYWEISYKLRNTRTPYTEDHVFATELEALAAMTAEFRKKTVAQASDICRRLRALGMDLSTKELLENIAGIR